MESKTQQVEFTPPEGMTLPEGVGPGDEFDQVCTLRLKDNGQVCLVKVGDAEMPGYNDEKGEGQHDESQEQQSNGKPTYDRMMPEGSY